MRALAFVLIACWLVSCETPKEDEVSYASPAMVSTPLNHDPTVDFEIGRWWTNDEQLLRLDPQRSFALFGRMNRYHPPQERGVWSQQSYAVMWLEPYSLLPHEPVRVQITRIDGELVLVIPKLKPMRSIEAAPVMVEDSLLGTWEAPHGTLEIRQDRRYSFSPRQDLDPKELPLVGHRGNWRLDGDQLVLRPDAIALGTMALTLETEESEVRLKSADGDFEPATDDQGID